MAYNYLGLVNDVNGYVNEVQLTSSNFSSALGFYQVAKDAVNASIRDINQYTFHWPFNYVEQRDVLTAGENRYSYPYDAKTVMFDTFRIIRDDTLGHETRLLEQIDYEEYLEKHIDDEYNTSTSIRRMPHKVARGPGQEYILWPVPDQEYELVYEYYTLPVDLNLYSDVPTIPEQFRHIIVDGAMYYVYKFRGDHENTQMTQGKFNAGIANMRKIYVNRYEYMRDTRVPQRAVV